MTFFRGSTQLTHKATMAMLAGAIDAAEAIDQPQCIVIVDVSGEVLGEIRMSGSRFLSRKSALPKALTAASTGAPSAAIPETARVPIGMASGGAVTGLKGGLPIRIKGELVGGIGVGSGSGEQDVKVAQAALAAIGADEVI